MAERVRLLAPSQPSTYAASSVSDVPWTRSVRSTRTGPSPFWVRPVTSVPPRSVAERVAGEVGAQERLELRLVEHGGLGKAVPAPVGAPRELGQHRHVGPDEPQTVAGPRHRGELVAHAQSGQDAVDLVVEVHGPGLRVDRLPPVEHQALDPVSGRAVSRPSTRSGRRR